MPKTKIQEDALPDLTNLASWVRLDARMEAEKGKENILVCVDKGTREAKVRPLLEKLGYANIPGHLASLQRRCGKTTIDKPNDRPLLFFPLSIGSGPESIGSGNIRVAGEDLEPGTYIQLTETLELDTRNAQLDCLIVLLP